MKKPYLKNILILSAVILITAQAGFCANAPIKQTAIKFLFAMGGVALSSFLIYAGLTIYNKIFVDKSLSSSGKEDSLSTPTNVEDAITFFIKKNKLK